jgi:hypothetical protein
MGHRCQRHSGRAPWVPPYSIVVWRAQRRPESRLRFRDVLEWERTQLLIGRRRHPTAVQVARTPAGSWYVVWRNDDGWQIAYTEDVTDPESIWASMDRLALAADARLVAEVWAAGIGAVVRRHRYHDAEFFENDDGELVSASWECRCGAGEVDFDDVGEALAAARTHWRDSLKAALDEVRPIQPQQTRP